MITLFFKLRESGIEVFLLLLQLLRVLLFPLTRVEARGRLELIFRNCLWEGYYLRSLSIPQEPLLLLQLFLLRLVIRLHNQRVDVVQVSLRWDLKSSVLFPDPVLPDM